jgi:hypothetical protein
LSTLAIEPGYKYSYFAPVWYFAVMNTAVSIWEQPDVRDALDAVIAESKTRGNYDLIMAQIPSLFGDSDKATYLGFRALGFRPNQVLEVMQLPSDQLEIWYDDFPEMKVFEKEHLWDLQRKINADIVRLQFMRNMVMFLMKDSLIIRAGMVNSEGMSQRDFDYFKTVRRFYDTGQLLNLEKAIAPEKHRSNSLVLNFGPNQVTVVGNEDGTVALVEDDRGFIDADQAGD